MQRLSVVNSCSALPSNSLPSHLRPVHTLCRGDRQRRLTECMCSAGSVILAACGVRRNYGLETSGVKTQDTQRVYSVTASQPRITPSRRKLVVSLAYPVTTTSLHRRNVWESHIHSASRSALTLKELTQLAIIPAARSDKKHEEEKVCWELKRAKGFFSTEREYAPNFEEIILGAVIEGKVLRVCVSEGQLVPKDAMLLRLEVGAVESLMRAPFRGTVASVTVRQGDRVTRGQPVVVMLPQPDL